MTTPGTLTIDASGAITPVGAVSAATFNLQGGSWTQNSSSLPSFQATDFQLSGGTFLRVVGGNGAAATPYLIADVYGLQGINSSGTLLSLSYQLAKDIDASGTSNWNSGAGFVPIGTNGAGDGTTVVPFQDSGIIGGLGFTGTLDGQSHTISGLFIDRPTAAFVGLIGYAKGNSTISVENLNVTGANITGKSFVGGVVGNLDGGTVTRTTFQGTVTGTLDNVYYLGGVGGLVGVVGRQNWGQYRRRRLHDDLHAQRHLVEFERLRQRIRQCRRPGR